MNSLPESSTAIYHAEDGDLRASIASIPLGLWGEQVYSGTLRLRIRLSSMMSSGDLVAKEFSVGFNATSVDIVDHDYGNPGPDLAATLVNGVTKLYTSGFQPFTRVDSQLLYCNNPSFIEWLDYSQFDTDLSSGVVYRATHNIRTSLTYPFEYLNGWSASGGSNRAYSMNGMAYVDFNITGGELGNQVAPFRLPLRTVEGKDFPIMFTKPDGTFSVAKMTITGSGNVWMRNVSNNTLVSGSFFYRLLK